MAYFVVLALVSLSPRVSAASRSIESRDVLVIEAARDSAHREIELALLRSDLLVDLARTFKHRLRLHPEFRFIFRDCDREEGPSEGQLVEVCYRDLAATAGTGDSDALVGQAIWALLPGLYSVFESTGESAELLEEYGEETASVLLADLWEPGEQILLTASERGDYDRLDAEDVRCYLAGRDPERLGGYLPEARNAKDCASEYRSVSEVYRQVLAPALVRPETYDWWLARNVRRQIADRLGAELDEVTTDALLRDDLGADSMDLFETWVTLVESLGVREERGRAFETVGDVVAYADEIYFSAERVRGSVGDEDFYPQMVFYTTDRAATGSKSVEEYFGGNRGKPSYGVSVIAVPVSVHTSNRERQEWLRITKTKRIVVHSILPLEREPFFDTVREVLQPGPGDGDWSNDILVFVHGYNVRFHAALVRTAQIAYDYGFDGAAILYSWPSDGKKKSYLPDQEDAFWSVPHLSDFLEDLRSRTEGSDIHLISHSMGSLCMLRALERIALERGEIPEPIFENVLLTASDFDAQVFEDQLADNLLPLAHRWTLYASKHDLALKLSASMRNAKRLGSPITVVEGVDSVDASEIEASIWSVPEQHSYFAIVPSVASDVIRTLQGVAPSSRRLQRVVAPNLLEYWRIPTPPSQPEE